ncbi:hypothetical protein CB1_000875052 [Camelus ferus]|nr:hypothetical protein CB1_000875052 [Camelus ferus]
MSRQDWKIHTLRQLPTASFRNERCGRDEWEKNDCVKASQSVTSPLSGGKKEREEDDDDNVNDKDENGSTNRIMALCQQVVQHDRNFAFMQPSGYGASQTFGLRGTAGIPFQP